MKFEKSDLDVLSDKIATQSEPVVQSAIRLQLKDFAKYCDSPIEALLGAAFRFAANTIHFARARATQVYLNEPTRDRPPLLPGQWEMVPQFRWENYRIDFAVFVATLDQPVFIECDGHDFHERTKQQAARDREKDRRIQAAGIPILRFTGSQIYADPLGCGFEINTFIMDRLEKAQKRA